MLLEKVKYRLFQHDVEWLNETSASPYQDIDREICLIGDNGSQLFISWVQDHNDFHLEWNDKPFFNDEGIVLDFSEHELWSDLVGKEVQFEYADQERFIIKISARDAHVYLCAYEQKTLDARGTWGFDGVHISKTIPKPYGD